MSAEESDIKTPIGNDDDPSSESLHVTNTIDSAEDPTKWYNRRAFGKLQPYSSGLSQVIMVSFVCFMCPGMFNALSGMGGAGLSSASLADKANIALYSTFATVGFFSGTIVNTVGVRYALAFGGSGYSIYIAAFLCYKHTANEGFIVFSGAWLGITAATLWAATSTCNLSYPTEDRKGTYMFIFWAIFNLGGVIGSLIPLGQNMHNNSGTVSDGTYVAFLILTVIGFTLSLFLLPVRKVRRTDGTKVIYQKHPTFWSEMKELCRLLIQEPWIMFLFPLFFSSNWFYTYEQSDFNTTNFTARTRALNSLLFWLMQMIGSYIIGYIDDYKKLSRKARGMAGWTFVFVMTHIIWGLGFLWDKHHFRSDVITDPIDFKQGHRYIGPMFLYMFYGFYDSIYQCYAYWVMGAITNSARKAAIYAGYYKGLQSAGAVIAWALDNDKKSYRAMYASTWGLLAGSLVIAFPILYKKIQETTTIEQDLKDTDETLEEIVGGKKLEAKGSSTGVEVA
ncbi:DEKNAAC102829 [Brettanomyces naardenensis]|uniref:DEKNAAC102829 n=1 Tax=Brettanomyces naardenensis TaxID=13370 RepID=A0A448YLN9_BRENA|nr:DEKNAAC102829 [Brettanomyces naardenensis]